MSVDWEVSGELLDSEARIGSLPVYGWGLECWPCRGVGLGLVGSLRKPVRSDDGCRLRLLRQALERWPN
jgi:hypothetical protein